MYNTVGSNQMQVIFIESRHASARVKGFVLILVYMITLQKKFDVSPRRKEPDTCERPMKPYPIPSPRCITKYESRLLANQEHIDSAQIEIIVEWKGC